MTDPKTLQAMTLEQFADATNAILGKLGWPPYEAEVWRYNYEDGQTPEYAAEAELDAARQVHGL